jgi:hypothetical protein
MDSLESEIQRLSKIADEQEAEVKLYEAILEKLKALVGQQTGNNQQGQQRRHAQASFEARRDEGRAGKINYSNYPCCQHP